MDVRGEVRDLRLQHLGGGVAGAGEEVVGSVGVGAEQRGVQEVRVGGSVAGAGEVETGAGAQAGGVGVAD